MPYISSVASRLLRKIEDRGRFGLHLESQIVGVDARRELRIVRGPCEASFSPSNQAERFAALLERDALRADRDSAPASRRPHHCRLIDRGQKTVGVHRLARFERALRIGHHDISGSESLSDAKAIDDPRTHARECRE